MVTHYRHGCLTDAGWCCLWDAAAFRHVINESCLIDALIDDAGQEKSIASGGLVPVNDFSDGDYDIGLRIADQPNEVPLSDQEIAAAIAVSRPYRFSTEGNICVSGMEYVGNPIHRIVAQYRILPGAYVAKVYRFDPKRSEMPEFLVALQPLTDREEVEFCTDVDTFNQQPTLPTGHVSFHVHGCNDWQQLKRRIVEVTGHEASIVSMLLSSNRPVYLGNGYQDPERIAALVQPLIEAVIAQNGTFAFDVDGERMEPSDLLSMFRRDASK